MLSWSSRLFQHSLCQSQLINFLKPLFAFDWTLISTPYILHIQEKVWWVHSIQKLLDFVQMSQTKVRIFFSLLSMNQWLRWCVLSRWARSPGALWVKNETSPNNRVVAYVLSACFVDLLLSSFRRRIVPRFCHFPPQAQIQASAKLLLHNSRQ